MDEPMGKVEDMTQVEEILKGWLPTSEAESLTGYSEAGLRRLRKLGRIRFVMTGPRVLWCREDLEKLGPRSKRGRPKKEAPNGRA